MIDINIPFAIMTFVCGIVFGAMPVWAIMAGRFEDARAGERYWRTMFLDTQND